MINGLSIDEKSFKSLPQKEQLLILYQNTEELKNMISGYKFQMKLQYVWLGVLSILLGAGKYLGFI